MKNFWITKTQGDIEVKQDSNYSFLYVGTKNSEPLDINLNFIHTKPKLNSNILIKCILFDNSIAKVFGNLVISKGAKYTDSYLKIDILMMSESAKAIAIPSLEITEDDVKGGHGATVGSVDKNQLHYLMSKGISRTESEILIAEGFAKQVRGRFEEEPEELLEELKKLNVNLHG